MSEITGKELRNLSDDELTPVSGGTETTPEDEEESTPKGFCKKCKKMMPVNEFTGGRYTCKKCGTKIDEKDIKRMVCDENNKQDTETSPVP